jgi:hypothetical protein
MACLTAVQTAGSKVRLTALQWETQVLQRVDQTVGSKVRLRALQKKTQVPQRADQTADQTGHCSVDW